MISSALKEPYQKGVCDRFMDPRLPEAGPIFACFLSPIISQRRNPTMSSSSSSTGAPVNPFLKHVVCGFWRSCVESTRSIYSAATAGESGCDSDSVAVWRGREALYADRASNSAIDAVRTSASTPSLERHSPSSDGHALYAFVCSHASPRDESDGSSPNDFCSSR